MDTLTHALSGALLGRVMAGSRSGGNHDFAPPRPAVWQMVFAGALAATFPDGDVVFRLISEMAYLRNHRGVTHSLLLLPLWGALLAWLTTALLRRRTPGLRWREFYAIACAGIALHIAGDYITQFGTMMLWPLSERRFELGSVFIIDLVFTGIIVAGLLGSLLWRRSRLPAALALAALCGWIGVTLVGKHEALRIGDEYAAAHGIAARSVNAVPQPASPFNWTVIIDDDGRRYHLAYINTRRQAPLPVDGDAGFIRRISAAFLPAAEAKWQVRERFGAGRVGEFAQQVWHADEFGFFRWFAMFPAIEQVRFSGELLDSVSPGDCAEFADLRFDTPGRGGKPFVFGLCENGVEGWRLYRRQGAERVWLEP